MEAADAASPQRRKDNQVSLRTIWALLAATVMGGTALGQNEAATTISRTWKAGDVIRMKFTATGEVAGTEVVLERTLKTEVKEVKENGEIVLVQTDLGGTVSAGGQAMDIPGAGPATTTVDKRGRLVKFTRAAADMSILAPEVEQLVLMTLDYLLPDKEVRSGDNWETELPNPLVPSKKIKVKTNYVGMDKLNDVRVWKIKQAMTVFVDTSDTKMSSEIVFLVDPASGAPQTIEGTLQGVPTQFGSVKLKLKSVFLKPESPKAAETPAPR